MTKLLKTIMKNIIVVIVMFVLIIAIPFLIYCAFKIPAHNSFFDANGIWTAGDILGFYGVVLGAIVASLGVFFTIQYSQKQFREDTEIRVRPFFAMAGIDPENNGQFSRQMRKKELFGNNLYLFITDTQETHISPIDDNWVNNIYPHIMQLSYYFEIENVGEGIADMLCVKFNPDNSSFSPKGRKISSFQKGQKCYLHLFSQAKPEEIVGKYNIDFEYYDMYHNRFRQRFTLEVKKDDVEQIHFYFQHNPQEKITDEI